MTIHTDDLAWAQDAYLARIDLEDWAEDYAELLRLEAELASPPVDRIPDEVRWYRMRQDAIRGIKDRWGAR